MSLYSEKHEMKQHISKSLIQNQNSLIQNNKDKDRIRGINGKLQKYG